MNAQPLGSTRRWGSSSVSSGGDGAGVYEREAPKRSFNHDMTREPAHEGARKRRSRWGNETLSLIHI